MHVTPSAPRLRLFAHVDATAGDIAPHEAATADAFEKAYRPDVAVTLQLRHVPSENERAYPSLPLSTKERWTHRALATGSLLGLGGLAAAAIATPLGPVARVVAATGAGIAALALGVTAVRSGSLLQQGHYVPEPEWEGTRTYEIGPDRTNQLDSPVTESKDDVNASVADLARLAKDGDVAVIAGHGNGWHGCAGFKMRELQLALKGTDLVVFESCLMGNLEALEQLHGTARYAVVSEKTQLAGLEHWKPLLEDLQDTTPLGVGRALLAQERQGNTTLALVDLEKLHDLRNDLEALAPHASPAALRASTKLHDTAHDFRDLGSVLENLAMRGVDVTQARADLKAAVIQSQGVLSQLSIQGPDEAVGSYAQVTGMKEWSALLQRA